MILAGDVGGTKTNLALYDHEAGKLVERRSATYPSADHAGLEEIAADFLRTTGARVAGAGFGVAGPVKNGVVATTNLPWVVDSAKLAKDLSIPRVVVLNDLEANAWGIGALGPSDFRVLSPGAPDARGHAIVVAAGTGLGEAILYWDGTRHRPSPSEGGHASFAPTSPLEMDLLRHLAAKFGHVSWERVLSGPGFVNVYEFARATSGEPEPDWLAAQSHSPGAAAAISKAALANSDPVCVHALDLFSRLYGAEAGNLALKVLSTGGVYLGGGIAPKIQDKLADGSFMAAFLAKGRMRPVLEAMPVRIVLNDRAALLGAALSATVR